MEGFLKIGDTTFELNTSALYSKVGVMDSEENEGTYMLAVNVTFQEGIYDGEEIKPDFGIYYYEMNVDDVSKMVGMSIEMNDRHQSIEREDLVVLIENEAFEKYKINILGIENDEMHVEMSGSIIKDIDKWPLETVDFYMDCWLVIDNI